jgi:hypothetical protein
MGNPNVAVNVGLLIQKELKYRGSFRYGVSDQSEFVKREADVQRCDLLAWGLPPCHIFGCSGKGGFEILSNPQVWPLMSHS